MTADASQSGPDLDRRGAANAAWVRERLPRSGLFAGQDWRTSPEPFPLPADLHSDLDQLGRVLLQFYRTANLLYRKSVQGKMPGWIAEWLDRGKPPHLVARQRDAAFKNDVPRVIRPDILLTDHGYCVTELDSVPGGIGLTAWLNQTYADLSARNGAPAGSMPIGGRDGMREGFASIFDGADRVRIVISEESATYRPEMEWLCDQLNRHHERPDQFRVVNADFTDFRSGDAVYRFFELFDLENVPNAGQLFDLARDGTIRLTPPPKPFLEEKMWFALFWNGHLRDFWRQELGGGFTKRLERIFPESWVLDPTPLPPHAAIPGLNLTSWDQLKGLSQRNRDLILKASGFSENAWGARSVSLGSDLSGGDWSRAVDFALDHFNTTTFVLQRYEKPRLVQAAYHDFGTNSTIPMQGRARICPYYFVHGTGDEARAHLGGVLATICPADKKIIHGMKDAILAPAAEPIAR